MAPRRSRGRYSHRSAPYARRRSLYEQEQIDAENNRPRARNVSARPESTLSTDSSSPSSSNGQDSATAPNDGNSGNASQGNQPSNQSRQPSAPSTRNLVIVDRATVLYQSDPLSPEPMLHVLDISVGSTRRTDFCAPIEGSGGVWVAKVSNGNYLDELCSYVTGGDSTRSITSVIFTDSGPQITVRINPGGLQFTTRREKASHVIAMPSDSYPTPDLNDGEVVSARQRAGLRELVERIGGCWNV